MGIDEYTGEIHDLDVTLWVGKAGVESASEELATQLKHRELVKVRVLRAGRSGRGIEEIAEELASSVDGRVIDVRGHTTVIGR